jgi:DNA-binding MarR family transcriptional regulator
MTVDRSAAARQQLLTGVRDLLKAVRLFKNQQPRRHATVPAGTLGILSMINSIESHAGCHSKDLAAQGALDPSTVSRAVAALVRAGLVVRAADPSDGRASVLAMTPHGREVLEDINGWYEELLADALRDWSVQDIAALTAMLQRFSDDLIARFDRHGPTDGHTLTTDSKTLEAAR